MARRSPAITTPSANRTATQVVACVTGITTPGCGSGSWPTLRNKLAKLGPGSSAGGNRGIDIGVAEATEVGPEAEASRPPTNQGRSSQVGSHGRGRTHACRDVLVGVTARHHEQQLCAGAALVGDQLLDERGADARRSPFALHGHPGDLRAIFEGTRHREKADDLAAVVGHIAGLRAHCGGARVDATLEPEEVGKARQHRVARWRVSALELADDHRARRSADTRRFVAT